VSSTVFEYPLNVHVGDKVVIQDTEEHRTYLETVISEPERVADKVHFWTDKRHLFCDPALKIHVRKAEQ
jgi:hypothetical protein